MGLSGSGLQTGFQSLGMFQLQQFREIWGRWSMSQEQQEPPTNGYLQELLRGLIGFLLDGRHFDQPWKIPGWGLADSRGGSNPGGEEC